MNSQAYVSGGRPRVTGGAGVAAPRRAAALTVGEEDRIEVGVVIVAGSELLGTLAGLIQKKRCGLT